QASVAQAIRQDHAQQIHRTRNHTGAQERFALARTGFERLSPAKPGDDALPILGHKRFGTHPIGESRATPARKHYLSAYARKRGPRDRELGQRTGSPLPRGRTEFNKAIQVQLISPGARSAKSFYPTDLRDTY